jgi:hypothetical protein
MGWRFVTRSVPALLGETISQIQSGTTSMGRVSHGSGSRSRRQPARSGRTMS